MPKKQLKNKKLSLIKVCSKIESLKNLKIHKNYKIIVLSITILFLAIAINFLLKRFFVASVNGSYLTRIQLYSELEKVSGQKTLDDLITKKLIYQEAKKRNINVTNNDINLELNKISESIVQQGSTLENALAMQGMKLEDLKENIKIQKILEQLLTNESKVTDEEINKYYEDNKSSYGVNQKLDDLRETIRQQLFQQKLTSAYKKWLQDKKSSSDIRYFVKYE